MNHRRCVTQWLILGYVSLSFLSNAHAQFTADYQTNIISGVTNWAGFLSVCFNYDHCRIEKGGAVLISENGEIGCTATYGIDSDNNSVLVVDSGSVWSNAWLQVGNPGAGNSLVVSNGATVHTGQFDMGDFMACSTNNTAVVDGSGSALYCDWLFVGSVGPFNQLIIKNGGAVHSGYRKQSSPTGGCVGSSYRDSGSNNLMIVSGSGSVWDNYCDIGVGDRSSGNELIISDGGSVIAQLGLWIGGSAGTTGNKITLLGGNLYATNNPAVYIPGIPSVIYIGYRGEAEMIISNGTVVADSTVVGNLSASQGTLTMADGTMAQSNMLIGAAGCSATGIVTITGGTLYVTNAACNAVLEVRSGTFTLGGGTILADILVVTNACARFIRNGGTMNVGTLVLDPNMSAVGDGIPNGWKQQHGLDPFDPNLGSEDADGDGMSNLQEYLAGTDPTNSASAFQITSLVATGFDISVTWTTGIGRTNALQATAAGDGGLYTNSFADIFTVTNAVGNQTNYFDLGAVTNFPSRFYRVRLVP